MLLREIFLSFNATVSTFVKFLAESVLDFTSSELWPVIPQLSQNRAWHKCFPSFFIYFFQMWFSIRVFQVFYIIQMAPNHAKHLKYL